MQNVVEKLVIPNAVAEEVTNYKGSAAGQINLAQEFWIRVEKPQSEEQTRLLLPALDRSEAEVIALALEKLTLDKFEHSLKYPCQRCISNP